MNIPNGYVKIGPDDFICTKEVSDILANSCYNYRKKLSNLTAYVYGHKVDNKVFYIGKSAGNHRSYSLHNRPQSWFDVYNSHNYVELVLFAYDLTNEQASLLEFNLINNFGEYLINSELSPRRRDKSRSVNQYDKDGNLLRSYDSLAQAAKLNNIDRACIQNVCKHYEGVTYGSKGKSQTAGGYIWKYTT